MCVGCYGGSLTATTSAEEAAGEGLQGDDEELLPPGGGAVRWALLRAESSRLTLPRFATRCSGRLVTVLRVERSPFDWLRCTPLVR